MKRFLKISKWCLGLSLAVILLSSCTTNPYTGQQQLSHTAEGAGIGAAGGAVIGSIFGKGTGAAIGAVTGAAVGGIAGNIIDGQEAMLRQQLQGTGVQIYRNPQTGDIRLIMPGDITFATDRADIRPEFFATLDSVAIVLRKYQHTMIQIDGYTDNTGTMDYNQRLAEHRAHSVADYLHSQGINPHRLSERGFGQRHPVASNASASGRALNRRVEITIHPI